MTVKLGMDAKIYYDASGVGGSSWTELTKVKDVTLNMAKGEADVTTRANDGYRATVGTLKEGSVDFEMVNDDSAGFNAIKNAFFNNAEIGIAVMDGDIETSGSQGLQANMHVMNFTRSEPLEEAQTYSVTLKPSSSISWLTVGS